MKPAQYIRKAKGYCCIWCDGHYRSWKKQGRRAFRRRDKAIAKKEMEKTLQESLDKVE